MAKQQPKGFSTVAILVVLVVAAAGASGLYVWHKNKKAGTASNVANSSNQSSNSGTKKDQAADPSEGGKYLVVKEWGVRVALSDKFQNNVGYKLSAITTDTTGNRIQGATLYIKGDLLSSDSVCAATSDTSIGEAINTGAQYIRSESSEPFDATRYKGSFKENILKDSTYAYHLNYIAPDCAGGGANSTTIEALQNDFLTLSKV